MPSDERSTDDYQYVPADKDVAEALDTAERLANEADAKFCAAFGGDGETSAYWLTLAIAHVRAALARTATSAPPAPQVTEAMVAPLIEALHGMGYPAIRHADARRALTAALRGGAR